MCLPLELYGDPMETVVGDECTVYSVQCTNIESLQTKSSGHGRRSGAAITAGVLQESFLVDGIQRIG